MATKPYLIELELRSSVDVVSLMINLIY